MSETEKIVMQACHDGLKLKNPILYKVVKGLVERGQSPEELDNFLEKRLLIQKGSPLRDSIYYTALYLKTESKE